jgi:hypothetical protein
VQISAELPSLWVAHCHCSQCRRAHGAGFVSWIGFRADACRIRDDAACLRWYASSAEAERGFCFRCSSMMMFRSSRWPGELHIALGVLDDPPDRSPQAHVFWASHVDWSGVAADDGLPRKD